jgi:hypothetical protein
MDMKKTIGAFCIWRDNEDSIYKTLSQLEEIEKEFDVTYFFYENDSKDNTPAILKKWMSGDRKGSLKVEVLGSPHFKRTLEPERMGQLCSYRNKCKKLSEGLSFDYAVVFDSEIIFSVENLKKQIKTLIDTENCVMVCPNIRQNIYAYASDFCLTSYYDVYPFKDRYGNRGIYFADCPSFQEDDMKNWRRGNPVRVNSAFGGFAVIKWEAFEKVSWSSDLNCDHVNFCYDLSRYGDIYIDSASKVQIDIDLTREDIDLERFRKAGEISKKEIAICHALKRRSL